MHFYLALYSSNIAGTISALRQSIGANQMMAYLVMMAVRLKAKRAIVQVKSGKATSAHIRDLKGTLDREKAEMGLFLTLEPPTRDMKTEAASAGFYTSPGWGRDYPRVQILTIEELLEGAEVKMPPGSFPPRVFGFLSLTSPLAQVKSDSLADSLSKTIR